MVPLRFATMAMGTRFELVLPGAPVHGGAGADSSGAGGGAAQADLVALGEAALAEIQDWHRRLTRFAPDSLVSHINRTAGTRPVVLDPDTFELFRDALRVRAGSDGAFDIAGGRGDVLLDAASRTVRFSDPGVTVDLGGIAKGHALDQAAKLLRSHRVTEAFLHGGRSSVVAMGAPEGTGGWQVALDPGPGAQTVVLRDEALSVSEPSPPGNANHILDPRTGAPPSRGLRVAVIGPSARLADAWSTAAAVLGARPGGCSPEWTIHMARAGSPPPSPSPSTLAERVSSP